MTGDRTDEWMWNHWNCKHCVYPSQISCIHYDYLLNTVLLDENRTLDSTLPFSLCSRPLLCWLCSSSIITRSEQERKCRSSLNSIRNPPPDHLSSLHAKLGCLRSQMRATLWARECRKHRQHSRYKVSFSQMECLKWTHIYEWNLRKLGDIFETKTKANNNKAITFIA